MIRTHLFILCALASLACLLHNASASTVTVDHFNAYPATPVADQWYTTDVRPGGSASIQTAPAVGPLGSSAARLTTDSTNASKAEVGTFANFGSAAFVLNNVQLSYSYYKTANGVENANAPSLKLQLFNSSTGSFGTLVYEPYWNAGGTVPANSWQNVSITPSTGAGNPSSGGWWWTGGFGHPNSFGGPPLQSLQEWLAAFQTGSGAADFMGASVIQLSMGVGSFQPNQLADYFDAVHIQVGGINRTYDFESPSAVPESGTTFAMLGLALLGLGLFRFRSQRLHVKS